MPYGESPNPMDWGAMIAALWALIVTVLILGQLVVFNCLHPWC